MRRPSGRRLDGGGVVSQFPLCASCQPLGLALNRTGSGHWNSERLMLTGSHFARPPYNPSRIVSAASSLALWIIKKSASPGERAKRRQLSTEERAAIWEAHKKRCPYSGDLIAFSELDIDHVVPVTIERDELKQASVRGGRNVPNMRSRKLGKAQAGGSETERVPTYEEARKELDRLVGDPCLDGGKSAKAKIGVGTAEVEIEIDRFRHRATPSTGMWKTRGLAAVP